ncbi:MAG TPA: ABC transporter permease [Candidatus Binataceae bacterium]|nr:ABC transporter permease [Candidatus Binataceae bacterium]
MTQDPLISIDRTRDGILIVQVSGSWRMGHGMPSVAIVERELNGGPPPRRVVVRARDLREWDSSLLILVAGIDELCQQRGIPAERSGLPEGVSRLIGLAETVPETTDARAQPAPQSWLARVGIAAIGLSDAAGSFLEFLGQLTTAFVNLLRSRARYRTTDLFEAIQQCGADALGIVSLISYLVGIILAFMGAVQLQQFGAALYVADLVGIGIVREMGAMMTAIIMAGRTGAAFAARLGTMKVTQEIDALATMGISPMEFLVLPRVIALVLMMPLLCLYSDLVGILGGATIGVGMLGLSFSTYLHETVRTLSFGDLAGGLFKATVYGILIAYAGCLRGFQCGDSSSAVGDAATAAVVTAIVMIVGACCLFALLFHVLGI